MIIHYNISIKYHLGNTRPSVLPPIDTILVPKGTKILGTLGYQVSCISTNGAGQGYIFYPPLSQYSTIGSSNRYDFCLFLYGADFFLGIRRWIRWIELGSYEGC